MGADDDHKEKTKDKDKDKSKDKAKDKANGVQEPEASCPPPAAEAVAQPDENGGHDDGAHAKEKNKGNAKTGDA